MKDQAFFTKIKLDQHILNDQDGVLQLLQGDTVEFNQVRVEELLQSRVN